MHPDAQEKIKTAGDGISNDGLKSKVGNADRASAAVPRDKYHVVASVDGGLYTEWQVRICYYHYKKMRREYPGSPMGGFTRLLHRQLPVSGNIMRCKHSLNRQALFFLSNHLHDYLL